MELGTAQEEQSERYQHGPKSLRHLQSALEAYELAARIGRQENEDIFDAIYNGARCLVSLGEDFAEGRSEPLAAVQKGIAAYREAIALRSGEASESVEAIDARFNLAQALSSLADMIDDGAESASSPLNPTEVRKEAVREFRSVLDAQQRRYKTQEPLGPADGSEAASDVDMDDATSSASVSSAADTAAATAEETVIITPSILLDTIFAFREALLAAPSAAAHDEAMTLLELGRQLNTSIAEDRTLSRTNELQAAEVDLKLAILDGNFAPTNLSAETAGDSLAQVGVIVEAVKSHRQLALSTPNESFSTASEPASQLSAAASLAATVIGYLSPSASAEGRALGADWAHLAQSAHQELLARLNDRLNPIKGLKTHEIPPLKVRNLIAQAEASLLAGLLDPSSGFPDLGGPFQLAVDAFNASMGPDVLSLQHGRHHTSASFSNLQLSVAKRPPSTASPVRNDWPCLSARLEALRLLVRLRGLDALAGPSSGTAGLEQNLRGLVARLGGTQADMHRWSEECEGDGIALAAKQLLGVDADAIWRGTLGQRFA